MVLGSSDGGKVLLPACSTIAKEALSGNNQLLYTLQMEYVIRNTPNTNYAGVYK